MAETDLQKREGVLWAVIAYVLHIVGAGLVLWTRKQNKFARYHAKQSLVLCISWIITMIVLNILMMISFLTFKLWYVAIVAHLFFLLLLIIGLFNALLGRQKPLPLLGKVAEEVKL